MSLFGIGPLELIFILIIMILVLGPKNMVSAARSLGVTLRKIVKSPMWTSIMDTSREIREIPTKLIRDAGIEEDIKNIKKTTDSIKNVGNISVTTDPIVTNIPKKSDIGKDLDKEKKILPDRPLEKTDLTPKVEQEKTKEEPEENSSSKPVNPPSDPAIPPSEPVIEHVTDKDGDNQDSSS